MLCFLLLFPNLVTSFSNIIATIKSLLPYYIISRTSHDFLNLLVKLLIAFHICASCELLYFKSFVDIYNNYQSKILNHEKPIL
jgi:hypothetical protein